MKIKITKNNIKEHIWYDYPKYLLIILAVIIVFSFSFSMFAKRLEYGKKFEVFVLEGELDNSIVDAHFKNWSGTKVIENYTYNYYALNSDLPIVTARLFSYDGDVIIAKYEQIQKYINEVVVVSLTDVIADFYGQFEDNKLDPYFNKLLLEVQTLEDNIEKYGYFSSFENEQIEECYGIDLNKLDKNKLANLMTLFFEDGNANYSISVLATYERNAEMFFENVAFINYFISLCI